LFYDAKLKIFREKPEFLGGKSVNYTEKGLFSVILGQKNDNVTIFKPFFYQIICILFQSVVTLHQKRFFNG